MDEGASCLSPASFVPQKDGWEFLGWRDTQTAGDALADKVMGDEPITLYAMFKYPDKNNVSIINVSWSNPSWPSEKTILSNIDMGKYSALVIGTVAAYLRSNFNGSSQNMYLYDGVNRYYVTHAQCDNNNYSDGNFRGSKTLSFSKTSGTTYISVIFDGTSTTIGASFENGGDNTLIGRTIVG